MLSGDHQSPLSRTSSSSSFFVSSSADEANEGCRSRYNEIQALFSRLSLRPSSEALKEGATDSVQFDLPDTSENIAYDDSGGIVYATGSKLIEKLTSTLDNALIDDFLLTYRCFMSPDRFAGLVLARLADSFSRNDGASRQTRVRTFVVIRHWVRCYWDVDFEGGRLASILTKGIDEVWKGAKQLLAGDKQLLLKLRHLINQESAGNHAFISNARGHGRPKGGFFTKLGASIGSLLRPKERPPAEPLDVSQIVRECAKTMPYCGRSILLRLDAELVAETLCLIEMEYFKSVGWPELLAYAKASASDSPGSSQNLQAIVTRFNQVCRWLSDEIQLSPGTAEQAELISALIRIAFKCLAHANYNSLMQIVLTLQSPAVEGLAAAWRSVGQFEATMFQDLAVFAGPWKNFRSIRKALEVLETSTQPCVPFTGKALQLTCAGLYISDLMINDERSTGKGTSDGSAAMIPFYKYRAAARIVRQFRTLQSLERQYPFTRHPDLYQHLIGVVSK